MTSTKFFLPIALLCAAPSLAQQEKKDVFADPQNLEVLPAEISSEELSDTMKGFAMGLGVRCETCHVGEPGKPLETFDFASDDKDMKRKARAMIGMVQEINSSLVAALNDIEDVPRVEVRCVTCHRGLPQPKLIEDVLDEALVDGGADAAVNEYTKLRADFYGSHSYDFSEFSLPMYAQELAARDRVEAAIALARINTENFPESYYSFFVLGELYGSVAQTDAAIDSYRRAAELNVRAKPFLDARIEKLKEAQRTSELQRQGPDNVAIDGYSPVSYFTKGIAERGSTAYAVPYQGLTYWLADAAQASEFESNPARYVPAHGGWCSLMLTGSGNLAVANPESFKIVDDRLLLFWSGDFQGQQISGLRNWESKFEDDEEELKVLGKADLAWSNLMSGSKKESVVFFNIGDEGRVNNDRRAAGKRMYK